MLSVVTASTVESVSIADVKTQARIDHAHEDDLIGAYITAARQWCEAYTHRPLTGGTNSLRLQMDSFGDPRYSHCGTIYLPSPPLAASSSVTITYLSSKGSTGTTVGSSVYTVDANAEPARIRPANGESWPVPIVELNAVTITFPAGYSTGASVPQGCRIAIRMLAANLYEHREPVEAGVGGEVPFGLTALLDPHKWGGYV